MSYSSVLRCLLVLAIAGSGECFAARIGELSVREGNGGVPCFTIAEAEEGRGGAPDFHAITVSEAGAGLKTPPLWRMEMPRQRTFALSFRMCIPYAGRLPVLPQTPAATLQAGKVYDVSIDARAPRSAAAPRNYRTRFCLVNRAHGVLKIGQVSAAGSGPKLRYVCGA